MGVDQRVHVREGHTFAYCSPVCKRFESWNSGDHFEKKQTNKKANK